MSYSSLGLTVPVSEVLDPKLWAERYAYGLILGPDAPASGSASGTSALHAALCPDPGAAKTAGAAAVTAAASQAQLTELVAGLPPETIRWHLRAALSELEGKLGTPMGIVVVKSTPLDEGLIKGQHYDREEPRRPFTSSDQRNWYKIDLPPNIISVERVRAYWFGQLVWEISEEQNNSGLFTLEWPRIGSGHILPTSLSNLLITVPVGSAGDFGALQLVHAMASPLPDVWAVDYTQGPSDRHTATPGHIPAVQAAWVYAVAGVLLLSLGGLARSEGLTNASISIDGLSKSIGLQASAIYGINSALENAYKVASNRMDWKRMKLQARGLRIRPYGH